MPSGHANRNAVGMRRIIVLNSKGGCGKTTVATNLAGRYAERGYQTALLDYDPQSASYHWSQRRGEPLPPVAAVAAGQAAVGITRSWQLRLPPDTERVVVDTPAAVSVSDWLPALREADAVLVPVLPSPLDMQATAALIEALLLTAKLRRSETRLGIVANRLRLNTRALGRLQHFLDGLEIPVVARLRDSQRYLRAAEQGRGVHELAGDGAYADREIWDGVVDWLEQRPGTPLARAFAARLRDARVAHG